MGRKGKGGERGRESREIKGKEEEGEKREGRKEEGEGRRVCVMVFFGGDGRSWTDRQQTTDDRGTDDDI